MSELDLLFYGCVALAIGLTLLTCIVGYAAYIFINTGPGCSTEDKNR